jgi:ATP-dependent Clp protease ATP-binding subunit ClpB
MEQRATDELQKTFRPEFLNRIDEIIFFEPLQRTAMDQIVKIQMHRYDRLLAERSLTLRLTDRAVAQVAERGYDPVYGARPLKRAIQKLVIDPLASELLAGHFSSGETIVGDWDPEANKIVFHHDTSPKEAAA